MGRRYLDFDAAIAEVEEEPVVVRYRGRDWELYPSLPAKLILRILRLQAQGRTEEDLTHGEMITLLTELVPPDVLDAWLDAGMTMDQMSGLIRRVVAIYNGSDGGDDSGEAVSPSSSSSGASSKQTSCASTDSISQAP